MCSKVASAGPGAACVSPGSLSTPDRRPLWADRVDGSLEDVFDLQDEVATNVVGAIAPRVERAEIERVKHKPTESLDSYDYYLRGMAATTALRLPIGNPPPKRCASSVELSTSIRSSQRPTPWPPIVT